MSRRGRGEGEIEQLPSGKWRATLSLGLDGRGKRKRLRKTCDTKQAALAWLRERQSERNRGELADSGKMTVGEWLAKWLTLKRPKVEPTTWAWLEQRVRLYLLPVIGETQLSRLDAMAIETMHADLTGRGVSAYGQRDAATVLRASLRVAVRYGLVRRNVALDVAKPKVSRRELKAWSAEQARTFLAAARPHRLYAFFRVALDGGLRPGELLALHWPDVEWERSAVRVCRSLAWLHGVGTLKSTKTRKGNRTVLLSAATMDALRLHRERMRRDHLDVQTGPLFPTATGTWPERGNLRHSFLRIVARADVPAIRLNDLRHTSASILLSAGAPLKAVSERLGHEDVAVTLRFYAAVLPSDQGGVAALAGQLLGGPTATP